MVIISMNSHISKVYSDVARAISMINMSREHRVELGYSSCSDPYLGYTLPFAEKNPQITTILAFFLIHKNKHRALKSNHDEKIMKTT